MTVRVLSVILLSSFVSALNLHGSQGVAGSAAPTSIRFAQWNIGHFSGGDGYLTRIAASAD